MPESTTPKPKSFKSTLNLPKTAFPMKANLVQNEPATLKRWQKLGLYEKLRAADHPSGPYVFHDGPPYANGSIHLGHLLNKVLKDIVVRSKTMAGYDCPYVPGWDCHGLPIEHKVMQELGDAAKDMQPFQVRRKCKSYAEKYVKLQSGQMQRLLTLADYKNPYLTMNPAYEGAVLEVFADLVAKGLVYRDLKPVHWSIENQTALADAELEYHDRDDTSVYVLFEVTNPKEVINAFAMKGDPSKDKKLQLVVWTTTPWTLPANLAVAVHPNHDYALVDTGDRLLTIAADLVDIVLKKCGLNGHVHSQTRPGLSLIGAQYHHPFIDQISPIVDALYVTLEDGTGLVHTAPGHGVEDYQTGLRNGFNIYCPVLADGTFDDTAPDWLQGKSVWDANKLVIERLNTTGHLLHKETINHSYPHDWRSKKPVIFRATEQWFISVNEQVKDRGEGSLRQRALKATERTIQFYPEWGRNRMRGMLETRPDWCISRQRAWGLPIPAFYHPDHKKPLLTRRSVEAVAQTFREHSSDAWFKADPAELLASYDPRNDDNAPAWAKLDWLNAVQQLQKGSDIFDVWFESGSSWNAVLRQRKLGFPADLYLEGSDQHRGWFQLSLLPALGVTGEPPFRGVLTHGFMVARDGRKMSKSGGNALEVDTLLKDFGADVCRWWVSSLNTDNDIKVDQAFFTVAGEEYRKVRNTLRYLLSNLSDFNPAEHAHTFTSDDARSIDAWALGELNKLIAAVREGYDGFHFRRVRDALFNFCNETMSAVYLTATKDRLYCDSAAEPRRRRTQTALHQIADALARLIAPVLPHTADEVWLALHGQNPEPISVHLARFPAALPVEVSADWPGVMATRDLWLKAIEAFRQTAEVDNPLDLGLRVSPGDAPLGHFNCDDLADLCGISRVELVEGGVELEVCDLRGEPRCERSWKRDSTVAAREDGSLLSDRDAKALGLGS